MVYDHVWSRLYFFLVTLKKIKIKPSLTNLSEMWDTVCVSLHSAVFASVH